MSLIRWNPSLVTPDASNLHRTMQRAFDDTFNHFFGGGESTMGPWGPAVDTYETEQELVINVEVPGFDKKDVDISVENGYLTISGERKFEETGRNYQKVERHYGKFQRTFSLPRWVDGEKISAHLKNGVLTLTLPKAKEAQAKRIPVSVN